MSSVASEASTVPAAEAPAATPVEATDSRDAADAGASDTEASDTGAAAPKSSAPKAPAPASAAPAPSASAGQTCSPSERPDGGQYFVVGIAADDADGGLVARVLPGSGEAARTVLPAGTVVDTSSEDGSEGPAGCAKLANGSVWYDIGHPSLATGGWVNARYLDKTADDHVDQPEEEADAHADCVYLPDLPDTCNVVYYMGFDITAVEALTPDMNAEFHHACVYQGVAEACDVLAFDGVGDGIGNSLSMTPTEFLVADCADLTGVSKKLACAELATR